MDVLIFVDCQCDFLDPEGKLYVDGSALLFENLESLRFAVQTRWDAITSEGTYTNYSLQQWSLPRIVYTADGHIISDPEISDIPDWKKTFPPHCIDHTAGSCLIDGINPRFIRFSIPYIVLHKNKFDVFDGCKYADGFFAQYPEDTNFYVCGVATNVCVKFVVEGLLTRHRNVYFVTNAMKELPGCNVAELFQEWEKHGAHGVDTKTACQSIRKGSAT